jgi:hypothetical protein
MLRSPLTALLIAAALAGAPAHGTVLYKSVNAKGVIEFSDMPPAAGSTVIEIRPVARPGNAGDPVVLGTDGSPLADLAQGDGPLARANAEVDLAEHALALARRSRWSPHDGLHLASAGTPAADAERIDYFKRNLRLARQNLLEAIRQQQRPRDVALASR